jgi:hypothetical protein
VWEVDGGRELAVIPAVSRNGAYDCWATSLAFLKGGQALALADRMFGIYTIPEGRTVVTHPEPGDTFGQQMTVNPSGDLLALSNHDGSTELWTAEGHLLRTLPSDPKYPRAQPHAWHGNLLARAEGRTVRFYRPLEDGSVPAPLSHPLPPSNFAFTPDGRKLAVVDNFGASVYDLEGRDIPQRLEGWGSSPLFALLALTGDRLVLSNRGVIGTRLLHPPEAALGPDLDAPPELEEVTLQLWTGQTLDQQGELHLLKAAEYGPLRSRWSALAAAHAAHCDYPADNLWLTNRWGTAP